MMCSEEDQLTILDLMEGEGLPTLIAATATASNFDEVLGDVLADAVQVHVHTFCYKIFSNTFLTTLAKLLCKCSQV